MAGALATGMIHVPATSVRFEVGAASRAAPEASVPLGSRHLPQTRLFCRTGSEIASRRCDMKAKVLLLFAVGFLLGADAPKEDATVKEVEKALRTLNEAFVKQDNDAIKHLMIGEHVAITSYFGRVTRDEQLKDEAN